MQCNSFRAHGSLVFQTLLYTCTSGIDIREKLLLFPSIPTHLKLIMACIASVPVASLVTLLVYLFSPISCQALKEKFQVIVCDIFARSGSVSCGVCRLGRVWCDAGLS